MRTLYWSEFNLYTNVCPERWRLEYPAGQRVKEQTEAMLEGIEVHQALVERLKDVKSFKPGRKTVLKEYHARYLNEDICSEPWKTEVPYTRYFNDEYELGCVADAVSPIRLDALETYLGFIRETKVIDRPTIESYTHQLLWNCWVLGKEWGQIDLIYKPSYERSEWAFDRINIRFDAAAFGRLHSEVHLFLERRNAARELRNSRSCYFCPFGNLCWGNSALLQNIPSSV